MSSYLLLSHPTVALATHTSVILTPPLPLLNTKEMRDIPLDAHMNIAGEDIHTNAYNNEYNNDAGIVPDTPPPPPPVVVAAVVAVVAEPTNRNATGLELRERREREIERGRVRGGGDYFMVS